MTPTNTQKLLTYRYHNKYLLCTSDKLCDIQDYYAPLKPLIIQYFSNGHSIMLISNVITTKEQEATSATELVRPGMPSGCLKPRVEITTIQDPHKIKIV